MTKASSKYSLAMRPNSFFVLFLVILFIAASLSLALSQTDQYQSIKGVKFKDGSVIMGSVIQMNVETVTIRLDNGQTVVRKFDDVDTFIKRDDAVKIYQETKPAAPPAAVVAPVAVPAAAPTTTAPAAVPSAAPAAVTDTISTPPPFNQGPTNQGYRQTEYENPKDPDYFVLKAGAYLPEKFNNNTGFNGEIAVGHYFNQNLAVELGTGYFQTSASSSASSGGISGYATADMYAVPLTLALKFIIPIDRLELYAIGGGGTYFCSVDVNAYASAGYSSASLVGTYTDYTFGGFLGGGAQLNFDNIFVGAEGRYLWLRPHFTILGTDVEATFDGWQLTGNIGFRFH